MKRRTWAAEERAFRRLGVRNRARLAQLLREAKRLLRKYDRPDARAARWALAHGGGPKRHTAPRRRRPRA